MEVKGIDVIVHAKGLKFIHVNTRSVFNKLDELKYKLKGFDIIVFTETWLGSSIDDALLQWEGYNLIRHDRGQIRTKKRWGCVYLCS